MTAVVSGVVVAAGGIAAGLASVRARRDGHYAPATHAPRDDAARDPLGRRLRQGYASVEIAVWLDGAGRLLVGGTRDYVDPGAELDRLVVRPLVERIEAFGGRVYRDSDAPLRLMIDIAEPDQGRQELAYERLEALLDAYPGVFARMSDGAVRPGPITVLLTGDHVPRQTMAGAAERAVFACGTFADLGPWGAPPTLAPLVSERWFARFDWDGRCEMPADERGALHRLVAAAHAEGRAVHFDDLPGRGLRVREGFWCELAAAGVDLITTARPRALANFLRGYVAVPADLPVNRSPRRAAGRSTMVPAQVVTPAPHRVARPGGAARVGAP